MTNNPNEQPPIPNSDLSPALGNQQPTSVNHTEPALGGERRIQHLHSLLLLKLADGSISDQEMAAITQQLGSTNDPRVIEIIDEISTLTIPPTRDGNYLKGATISALGQHATAPEIKMSALTQLNLAQGFEGWRNDHYRQRYLTKVSRVVNDGNTSAALTEAVVLKALTTMEPLLFTPIWERTWEGDTFWTNIGYFQTMQRLIVYHGKDVVWQVAKPYYHRLINFFRRYSEREDTRVMFMHDVVSYPDLALFRDESILQEVITELTQNTHLVSGSERTNLVRSILTNIIAAHPDKHTVVTQAQEFLSKTK